MVVREARRRLEAAKWPQMVEGCFQIARNSTKPKKYLKKTPKNTKTNPSSCLAPALKEGEILVFVAMFFGFEAAPLTMGRLSAALARLWQSMMMQDGAPSIDGRPVVPWLDQGHDGRPCCPCSSTQRSRWASTWRSQVGARVGAYLDRHPDGAQRHPRVHEDKMAAELREKVRS